MARASESKNSHTAFLHTTRPELQHAARGHSVQALHAFHTADNRERACTHTHTHTIPISQTITFVNIRDTNQTAVSFTLYIILKSL